MSHTQTTASRENKQMSRFANARRGTIERKPVRASTLRVYVQRWNVVVKWCEANGIDPERMTATEFADYLEHCFDEGKRYTYLKRHWVAFRYKHGDEKAHDREVKGVLQ